MIIARTPFRISFFGGGTDYPAWYRDHGGAVLASTINKYCYITCRHLPPFFEQKIKLVYSKIENCDSVDEIRHPAIRESLRFLGIERGIEIHHDADLPARCGMGSSSSFTVGLLHALYALLGRMPSQHQLALEAIHVEQELLAETVGSQDQISAAFGGLNHVTFHENDEFTIRPVITAQERIRELDAHLMLLYTGIKRTASDIAKDYVSDLSSRAEALHRLRELVEEGLQILTGNQDLSEFGRLLHEGWEIKRSLSDKTTNAEVDRIYQAARDAGAVGGKLAGAGGGGFMLLFAPPDRQPEIRRRLHSLIHVPINLESSGSQIIFYDPEQDYSAEEAARATQPPTRFRELAELEDD